jgi:hypothetical protein
VWALYGKSIAASLAFWDGLSTTLGRPLMHAEFAGFGAGRSARAHGSPLRLDRGLASSLLPTKPISLNCEAVLKRIRAINDHDQQRGPIMVVFILNAIYRQFLRSALLGMRRFPG